MINPAEKSIGIRIRSLRKRRGYSMRALAERCELSANAISLIERGENSPTITSLFQLALGLDVNVIEFFKDEGEDHAIYVKNSHGVRYIRDSVEMESLGNGLPNQKIEPYRVTIKPHQVMECAPVTHPGQEFIYGLEGKIECVVGQEKYMLSMGDSLLVDSTKPHCWINPSDEVARILLIFVSPLKGQIGVQGHLRMLSDN